MRLEHHDITSVKLRVRLAEGGSKTFECAPLEHQVAAFDKEREAVRTSARGPQR